MMGTITPTSPVQLSRIPDSIEAGIFSIDYPLNPAVESGDDTVNAFVFRVESSSKVGYLTLVGSKNSLYENMLC